MTPGRLPQVELARPQDVGPLHRLRRQLENWLCAQGIEQWKPGEVSEQEIAAQLDRGEWHVIRHPDLDIAAALRLLREDREIWGQDATPAVYVHGLMVNRNTAGFGLGESFLRWAGEQGRAADARVLRLDCAESNTALRAYYREKGFEEVGRRDFDHGWFSITLFEKRLESSSVPNSCSPHHARS